MSAESLLTVTHLRKEYAIQRGVMRRHVGQVRAVDDVSFSVDKGACFAVVGESGCGKTTLARCLLRLIEPDTGDITVQTEQGPLNVRAARGDRLRQFRRAAQIVFQDPFSSLDPRMTLGEIVAEPLHAQRLSHARVAQRVPEVLGDVGLDASFRGRYPHELSGGQRQRVGIARALAVRPSLIVLDEPVSALDVSVRAQILNVLLRLREQFSLTYVFISHDLGVVRHMSDRTAVMYLGELVEVGDTQHLFEKPRHPYTEALLASIPQVVMGRRSDTPVLAGDLPASPLPLPVGCRFAPRCPYAEDRCRETAPALRSLVDGRLVRCHFAETLDLKGGMVAPDATATTEMNGATG